MMSGRVMFHGGLIAHFLCIFLAVSVQALFEDQIGRFDWRKQNIGNVRVAKFSSQEESSVLDSLVVGTAENVVASINLENGEILWRQILGPRNFIDALDLTKDEVVIISGDNHTKTLQCFDILKGSLRWDFSFGSSDCSHPPHLLLADRKTSVALICDRLHSIDRMGDQVWSLSLSKYNAKIWHEFSTAVNMQILVVGKMPNDKLILIRVDPKTGTVVDERTSNYNTNFDECLILGEKFFCSDYVSGSIFNIANVDGVVDAPILTIKDGISKIAAIGNEAIAVLSKSRVGKIFRLNDAGKFDQSTADGIENVVDFNTAIFEKNSYAIFAVSNQIQNSLIWINDFGEKKSTTNFENSPDLYGIRQVFPVVLKSGTSRPIFLSIVTSKDHALAAFDETKKPLWVRQEALSQIVSVEMLDLPLSESQASVESEFSTTGQNIVSMLVRRLATQAKQIQRGVYRAFNETLTFLSVLTGASSTSDLISVAKSFSSKSNVDSAPFERDYFNLHKIIVVVTTVGKVYGLDNRRGRILWQFFIHGVEPFNVLGTPSFPLFVQRTTAHYPFPAQCVLVGKNKETGFAHTTFFDPVAGTVKNSLSLDSHVKQVTLLPVTNDEELFGLAMLTEDDQVVIYPSSVEIPLQKLLIDQPFFLFNSEISTGELIGYKLENRVKLAYGQNSVVWSTEKVWQVNFPPEKDGKIIDIKMKRLNEQVHSQGRVLGDRSVLYKYSNPNLVAVTLEKIDENRKSTFTIYLLDAITGSVLFVLTHRRVSRPFHLVHCENWLVYSIYNEKARRTEFTVLELYEGKHQTDPDKFSSYVARPQLLVMRQSYIFPQGVSALAVTDTEKGITSRHILVALPFGGLLELHKAFLDPRRVLAPTQEEREEGLIPYMPDLPIATEHIINYNQSVFNIRAIHTSSAGLESTSLVLAYGLDLFYTRVHPSATFDILKDDFDHWFISLMLLGLFLASIFTKRLAKLRDLKQAWK